MAPTVVFVGTDGWSDQMERAWIVGVCVGVISLAGCQAHRDSGVKAPPASAQGSSEEYHPKYLDGAAIARLESVMPDPEKDRGPLTIGEGDLLLAMQAEATPTALARAKSEESLHVWVYADVLGPGFNKDAMPLTAAVMKSAERDSGVVTRALKARWGRQRPTNQDDRIGAGIGIPGDGSYPSGHSVRSMMWARLLGEIDPDQAQALIDRARLVAYDRVIGGVHYPTDVAAGMALGSAIAEEIMRSPAYRADLDRARAEWATLAR